MIWRVKYWHKSIPDIAVYIHAVSEKSLLGKCAQRGLKVLKHERAWWLER